MEKKLQRIPHEGAVAGVSAGLGEYFGIDKTWVRVAFVVSVFFSGVMGIGLLGPILYIVLWIVLPVKSFVLPNDPFNVDYRTREDAGLGDSTSKLWQPSSIRNKANIGTGRYIAGGALVLLGTFFLLIQLNIFYWRDFSRLWPIFIIILGIVTIFGAFKKENKPTPFEIDDDAEEQPLDDTEDNEPNDNPTDDENTGHGYTK